MKEDTQENPIIPPQVCIENLKNFINQLEGVSVFYEDRSIVDVLSDNAYNYVSLLESTLLRLDQLEKKDGVIQ